MCTKATVIAPAIKFQTALNRKTEEVSPAIGHFALFRYKCYISNHSYKIITNSILYFGGTISCLGKTGYSYVFCYLPHGLVNISISCSKDLGPKRDEVTEEWRKLHNEELNNLYSLPNIVRVVKSRRMRWAGHVARLGEWRGAHRVLVGKPEGTRPLGRPRRRW
jgi:hypothetical protein